MVVEVDDRLAQGPLLADGEVALGLPLSQPADDAADAAFEQGPQLVFDPAGARGMIPAKQGRAGLPDVLADMPQVGNDGVDPVEQPVGAQARQQLQLEGPIAVQQHDEGFLAGGVARLDAAGQRLEGVLLTAQRGTTMRLVGLPRLGQALLARLLTFRLPLLARRQGAATHQGVDHLLGRAGHRIEAVASIPFT
jgi:hypothetical protein